MKVPKINFCPYCNSETVHLRDTIPECKNCNAIFILDFIRYKKEKQGTQIDGEIILDQINDLIRTADSENLKKAIDSPARQDGIYTGLRIARNLVKDHMEKE